MNAVEPIAKVEERFASLAEYSYENMCAIHLAPYRSIYIGGAGIAYAFWRAACSFERAEWLHQARLWIDHVAAAPQDDSHIQMSASNSSTMKIQVYDSLFFGDPGIPFVQALIAVAEYNPKLLNRALKSFTAPEKEKLQKQELLQGISGRLVGCARLLEEVGDEHLKEYGDTLADELLITAQASKKSKPWADIDLLGLAHGRAGNYYALLSWAKAAGYRLPEWFHDGLRKFIGSGKKKEKGMSWPMGEKNENEYINTWCNGAPGFILLWSLAYEFYDDLLFLKTARATGEYVASGHDPQIGFICCGAAGISYAFLSLYRVDPDHTWLDQAYRYANLAAHGMVDRSNRLSLYRGAAGIACLMLDMQNPMEARQPIVEA